MYKNCFRFMKILLHGYIINSIYKIICKDKKHIFNRFFQNDLLIKFEHQLFLNAVFFLIFS